MEMETSFCYQIYFGTDDDVTSRAMEDEVDRVLLKSAILKLTDREKHIMELRFGFKTGVEKTQKEVADMLGISQSYISRLEKKIMNKMKKDIMSKTRIIKKKTHNYLQKII